MPVPTGVSKLQRPLAREEAYALIRGWIVEGHLAPGERIQDASLAATLGVSRMPVREALLRLQSEGLVESAPNRWIRVSALRAEQGEELYPLIWTLEGLAVRLGAIALTSQDLSAMDEANERIRRAIAVGKGRIAYQADQAFHAAFVNASGNGELVRVLGDLKLRLRRLEVPYFAGKLTTPSSVDQHRAILKALRKRDVEAAAAAVETNWRRGLESFRVQSAGKQLDRSASADPDSYKEANTGA